MPNVLNPRDLVPRPDNMDETVLSSKFNKYTIAASAAKILHGEKERYKEKKRKKKGFDSI